MSGLLRIALVYFSVVPLHRWISIVGMALLLIAALFTTLDPVPGVMAAALGGAGMLAMGPVMMGGGMHRHASSRTVMHLRPNGRLRMLLAATLVVTLVATVAVIPVLVSQALPMEMAHKAPFRVIAPLEMFAIAWTITALMWAGTFITGASQAQGFLFALLPLALFKFGKEFAAVLPSVPALFAAGVLAWLAFTLWYMNVRSLRRMPSTEDLQALHADGKVSRFLQSRLESVRTALSPAGAINQYLLGSATPARAAFVYGIGWVLLAGAMLLALNIFVLPQGTKGAGLLMSQLIFLPLFMLTIAGMGFALTRRARLLWMRPGQDRAQLFVCSERGGLAFTMPAMLIAASVFLMFSLLSWPERSTQILLFGAGQVVFAFSLFYCGMSLTRGWAALDIVLCAAMCAFFVTEVVLLRPWNEEQSGAPVLLGIMLLLATVLRWHARRRWLAIDWRVARMLVARRPA